MDYSRNDVEDKGPEDTDRTEPIIDHNEENTPVDIKERGGTCTVIR